MRPLRPDRPSDVEDNWNRLRGRFGEGTEPVLFGMAITATRRRQFGDHFLKPIIVPFQPTYSIATFWPSTKPVSARPRRKSARTSTESLGVLALRYPIAWIDARGANAANGQKLPHHQRMNSTRPRPLNAAMYAWKLDTGRRRTIQPNIFGGYR